MKNYLSITEKYLKQHKLRTMLTLFGIIISIVLFTSVNLLYFSRMENKLKRVGEGIGKYEVCFLNISFDELNLIKNNAKLCNGGMSSYKGEFSIKNFNTEKNPIGLKINSYNDEAFENIFPISLVKGRLPKNSFEIIVDNRFYNMIKLSDNKIPKITLFSKKDKTHKEYTVVGSFYNNSFMSDLKYEAITYLEVKDKGDLFNYYASIKNNKNKVKIGKEVAKDTGLTVKFNNELLSLYRQEENNEQNDVILLSIAIIVFIMLCSSILIYNAFNISIVERIKHFAILRSIGATEKQIRKIVFKEAAIMCIIAIPIGIILGYIGTCFSIYNIKGLSERFTIGFYPKVIFNSIALGIITICISILKPVRISAKVSPIEGIKENIKMRNEILKFKKVKTPKFLKNFEIKMIYKNLKVHRKRFWLTTISLAISLTMVLVFNSYTDILNFVLHVDRIEPNVDVSIHEKKDVSGGLSLKMLEELKKYKEIKEIFPISLSSRSIKIEKNKVSPSALKRLIEKNVIEQKGDYYIAKDIKIIGYDENTFKLINKHIKSKITFSQFNDNKVILVNNFVGNVKNGEEYKESYTNYKVGDKIKLHKNTKDQSVNAKNYLKLWDEEGEYEVFEVAAIVDKEVVFNEMQYESFGIIMSQDNFKKITGKLNINAIGFNYNEPKDSENMHDTIQKLVEKGGGFLEDKYEDIRERDTVTDEIKFLACTLIILIGFISVVNIINTISMDFLMRKREIAILMAMGMSKSQLTKLILLQGGIYGIASSIIGSLISIIGVKAIVSWEVKFAVLSINKWPYILGSVCVILITVIASLIPLKRFGKMNIIDGIGMED